MAELDAACNCPAESLHGTAIAVRVFIQVSHTLKPVYCYEPALITEGTLVAQGINVRWEARPY